MRQLFRFCPPTLIAFFVLVLAVFAPDTSTGIGGIVLDPDSRPVPNATVAVVSADTGAARSATTETPPPHSPHPPPLSALALPSRACCRGSLPCSQSLQSRFAITDDGSNSMATDFVQADKTIGIKHFPACTERPANQVKAACAYAPRQLQFGLKLIYESSTEARVTIWRRAANSLTSPLTCLRNLAITIGSNGTSLGVWLVGGSQTSRGRIPRECTAAF